MQQLWETEKLSRAWTVHQFHVNARFSFDQEFLPQLRAAAKASDIPGMSLKKAAVVNISTALSSLQSVKETVPLFGAIALGYRTSKASDNLPH